MKTYPNQKVITINKAKADRENTYATINKECLMKAITELTHNELKIYLYLASNQNGFQLALSSADIADKTNASKRKIQESINSLIEKGYLVETGSNSYDFIEDTMYKKYTGDVHEKDTGICTKSTQECVQKVHSNVYKKDTEILHYNTLYNTSSIIQAEDKKEEDLEKEEEQKKEDTFINFLKGLNCNQLQEMKDMYSEGTRYREIASAYNIPYFEAAKFAENYETIYKEKYDMENPEQVERRQKQEQAIREQKRAEREEDAAMSDALQHMWKNNRKPAQDNNKPKPSTANKMTMIDGSAIDSRLTGQSFPESILDNINNGIITVDELVEMQFDSENTASSNVFW